MALTLNVSMNVTNFSSDSSQLVNDSLYSTNGQEPRCDTLKFVFSFVMIGSLCILGMIGNVLSLIVLLKIKVCCINDHFIP